MVPPARTILVQRRFPRDRRAFTLIETMLALVVTGILVLGLASALTIASRAIGNVATLPAAETAGEAMDDLVGDLRLATAIDGSAAEIVLTVPDRDSPPDDQPETIRYAWSGTIGDPLQRKVNDGPNVTVVGDVHGFSFALAKRDVPRGTPPPALDPGTWGYFGTDSNVLALDVLLVVVDAASPSPGAMARKAMLESWECAVTLIDAASTVAAYDTAVASNDVVYIAAEAPEADIGPKVRATDAGLVSEAYRLHDEMGLAGASRRKAARKTKILENTHEITLGWPTGDLEILPANQDLIALDNPIADGLTELSETDRDPSLVLLEAAAVLEGGGTAAARRVQLPWGNTSFDFNALNADGLTMLRRSLRWASESPHPANVGEETVLPTPVSNVRRRQIATPVSFPSSGNVASITAYIDQRGRKYRFAVYDDLDGEPGDLVVESAVVESNGLGWATIPVPSASIAAGTYWLALSFEDDGQKYYQESGGATRYRARNAVSDGFLSTWGTSDGSFAIHFSIYATYLPS